MDNKIKLIIDSFGKDRFKFNELIGNYTALKVGGPAKVFFIAFTQRELIKIITMCRGLTVPYFLFGTGSKITISDLGFNGIVIKNRTKVVQTVSVKGKVTKSGIDVEEAMIEVDGGVSINKWVEYLDSEKLESVEFAGIPGSIGGNLFFNRFLQNRTKSIKVLDSASEIEKIEVGSLRPKNHIILSAVFKIKARGI
ncbi:MAG: FAD-binding protein [Candidatus Daviesbacteria bacterium]|nr:FAD-binding protein [Candidatus Daviesbacteria bacterium]